MKLTQSQINSVDETIELDFGKKIVRLDYSGTNNLSEVEHNSNVFCIDEDYNIIWMVLSEDVLVKRDSFVSIEFEEGKLTADRFFGGEYQVDVSTGMARKIGWHK